MSDFPDDAGLLAAFLRAPRGAEGRDAFAGLARRYGGLIFHAGLRQTGRRELAEEAAQNTLAILARKAGELDGTRSLAAWLHRTACWQASVLARRERRHSERMKQAASLNEESAPAAEDAELAAWERALPHLDAALNDLAEADREVVLLKYFEGWSFEEMARRQGGQAAAWRKRGSRAVERLRRVLGRRGCPVGAGALAAGLGVALTEAAPAAVACPAAVGAALAAGEGCAWTTLAAHGWQIMKTKQMMGTAALVVALLVPLGFQRAASGGVRGRVAALTTSVEALRAAAGPAAEKIARSGGRPAPLRAPGTGGGGAVAGGIDLEEWAEVVSKREPGTAGEMAKALGMMRTLAGLDGEALEGLILAAGQMDLPPAKRIRLLEALTVQLAKKSPAAAMPVFLRMVAESGHQSMNTIFQAGAALGRWASEDPEAAKAWFDKARADGLLESKSLEKEGHHLSLEGQLTAQLIIGLMASRPEEAARRLAVLPPAEAVQVLDDAGRSQPPTEVLRHVKALPAELRAAAMDGAVRQLGRTDVEAAGRIVKESGLSDREVRSLLVSAAGGAFVEAEPGKTDLKEVSGRVAWLRRVAPEGQADKAVGAFIGRLGLNDAPGALQAWREEAARQRGPNPVLEGAFIRAYGQGFAQAHDEALKMAEAMPPGPERDRAIKELNAAPRLEAPNGTGVPVEVRSGTDPSMPASAVPASASKPD